MIRQFVSANYRNIAPAQLGPDCWQLINMIGLTTINEHIAMINVAGFAQTKGDVRHQSF